MNPARLLVPLIAASLLPVCAGALAAPAVPQSAAIPHQYGVRLLHTRWLAQDGAPRDIQSITQTPDGWLWLGTSDGIYRFDGMRFDRYQPRSGAKLPANIYRMGSLPDGTLWVIPFFGGMVLIKGDEARSYGEKEGLPGGSASQVVRAADGTLWSAFN